MVQFLLLDRVDMPRQPRTSASKGKNRPVKGADEIQLIKYAQGFKPPTLLQSKHAIGFDGCIPQEYNPGCDSSGFQFFKSIPAPSNIDDWLAQYNEEGQTYKEYLQECPWISSRKRKYMSQEFQPSGQTILQKYPDGKIYIVPVGAFTKEGSDFYDSLIKYTEIFLGIPVASLPNIKLEIDEGRVFWIDEPGANGKTEQRTSKRRKRHQLTSRYNPDTERLQVCVDSNLLQLRQMIPKDAICMIGLTMLDLYGEDSDLFVAGMAAGNQRVAIFSLFRYDPQLSFSIEHWYDITQCQAVSKQERHKLVLQRGCKLVVHEISHLLGVGHCVYYDCCMNGSGHLTEDFKQPMHLCPVDLRKLQTLVGFDVIERYKSLLQFYKEHGLKDEYTWIQKRLAFIQQSTGDIK